MEFTFLMIGILNTLPDNNYSRIIIETKDGHEPRYVKRNKFFKLENETVSVGDQVFIERIKGGKYKAYTINALKAECGEFLDIADKLTGKETLEVHIDPGTATSEEIAEYLIELKKLYMMMGGSGITYNPDNVKALEKSY